MLLSLRVKNMALIQEEEVEFGPGLNILTGETGAGKSMVIGSVNVALGTGSFKDYVSEETDTALVELTFRTKCEEILEELRRMDIPADDGIVVITRKFQKGRSISRVNGETVNMSVIRTLASGLIDLYGQHEHQSLLYPRFHLAFLDEFSGTDFGDRKERCAALCQKYRRLSKTLEDALRESADRAKQIDFLQFEINEIEEAALNVGEDERLEQDYSRMLHGQKIMAAVAEAFALTGYEQGAGEQIGRAVRSMGTVSGLDDKLENIHRELVQTEELLNDLNRSLSDYMDDFSYDEQEFSRITDRLNLINHLKSKYGKTIEDIDEYQKEKQEKLEQLIDYEGYLDSLRHQKTACFQEFLSVAEEISKIRKKHAVVLEKKITQALIDLNFLDVQFGIHFEEMEEPAANGIDEVCFQITTNPGMPLRPLQDVASGGELSRIMLALKSVMADRGGIDTLIFDEIDSGISGRTAQKVSEKMAVIAKSHQVICITHLAQIAAMADVHLQIEKKVEDHCTRTSIRQLTDEEGIDELARILGGVEITEAVRNNAFEMKELAEKIKLQN